NVRASGDLDAAIIGDAVGRIHRSAHPDAEIIFGMDFDPQMGDAVAVTVIATGFSAYAGEVQSAISLEATRSAQERSEAASPARPGATSDAPAVVAVADQQAQAGEVRSGGGLRGLLRDVLRREPRERRLRRPGALVENLSPLPSRATERPSYLRPAD